MADKKQNKLTRRSFIRTAATGAVAAGAAPMLFSPRKAHGFAGGDTHPRISALRVVGVHDDNMTNEKQPRVSWDQQEKLVRTDVVRTNMDKMACALAQEKNPDKAWRTIFVKPPGKNWSDVTVAIKTNHIFVQRTRSAVVASVCNALTNHVGVKGQNIFIYDACHGDNMSRKTPFKGLPEGTNLANKWGGYNTDVTVPEPYFDGTKKTKCLDHLVKDEVDILVDIALCKGHGMQFGGFTMSCKNHFGTFNPRPGHGKGGGADYLLGINKTPHLLGEMDSKGNLKFPRQQLCIIDTLWGSERGPSGGTQVQPNRIFMGTLPGALDYQVATKFRRDTMGWRINDRVIDRFLTEFGLKPDNLPNNGQIIDALEYTA